MASPGPRTFGRRPDLPGLTPHAETLPATPFKHGRPVTLAGKSFSFELPLDPPLRAAIARQRAAALREAAEAIRNGPWHTTVGRSHAEQSAGIVDALADSPAPTWVPWPTSPGFWWQRSSPTDPHPVPCEVNDYCDALRFCGIEEPVRRDGPLSAYAGWEFLPITPPRG